MYQLPKSISKLIEEFAKLPGVGPKTASRLTFYLIKNPSVDIGALGDAVMNLRNDLEHCLVCHNITDYNPCSICTDKARDKKILCVVEEPIDVMTIERSGSYKGLYHVLGGRLSPLEGVTATDLELNSLLERAKKEGIEEVIVATNHNIEGETTALYIEKLFTGAKTKLTRIASGLPAGSDLEYADEITLIRAFEGRRQL